MTRLVNHIDSKYFKTAQKFSRIDKEKHLVYVYVEGYEDISFWRGVLSKYETPTLAFEINIPSRDDLAKGKMVLLSMCNRCGDSLILCMDSDFDFLFDGKTSKSKLVIETPYIFQTYVYSIENFYCYAPSLRESCVKATNNDTYILDFEEFIKEYSRTIYPLFLWYIYSALCRKENFFPLIDFRRSVKINYIEISDNGSSTIEWLKRNVAKRLSRLESDNPRWIKAVLNFSTHLTKMGVTSEDTYLYMHGHTILDDVVLVIVNQVCEQLRLISLDKIRNSSKKGVALNNEYSNYKNTLRDVSYVIKDNTRYKEMKQYKMLDERLSKFMERYNNPVSKKDTK